MSISQIFKKVLIPCAAGVTSTEGHTFGSNCVKKTEQGTKPSDLPIYSKQCTICGEASTAPPPPSGMEEKVGNIRRELWVWQDNLKGYRHKIVDVYRNGFSKADCPGMKESESRNHLDRSFDEKSYQPSPCPEGKKPATDFRGFRSPWSNQPKFKLCLDRCGRPCSGEHRHEAPKEHVPDEPDCGDKPQAPPPCAHRPPAQDRSRLCEHKKERPPCEGSRKTKDYCSCCQRPECSGPNSLLRRNPKTVRDGRPPGAAIEYLRQESHGPQRMGAIGISGLAGYILGMRKGVFRKILYGCCGALGMAAVCYPNEAMDYLESVVLEGRRCFIVAYHFVYGETPDMPEWLEKFLGITHPPPQETAKPNENNLDLNKIMGIEESRSEDSKKKKS